MDDESTLKRMREMSAKRSRKYYESNKEEILKKRRKVIPLLTLKYVEQFLYDDTDLEQKLKQKLMICSFSLYKITNLKCLEESIKEHETVLHHLKNAIRNDGEPYSDKFKNDFVETVCYLIDYFKLDVSLKEYYLGSS